MAGVLAGPAAARPTTPPRVGPGPAAVTVAAGDYRVELRIAPNAGGRRENTFVVRTTRAGAPVRAAVSIRFTMPAMGMPSLGLRLRTAADGVAGGTGATLTMPGVWHLVVTVRPRRDRPLSVDVVDVVGL